MISEIKLDETFSTFYMAFAILIGSVVTELVVVFFSRLEKIYPHDL